MRRVDAAHAAPGLRGGVDLSPEVAIARLHELLRDPELSLRELAELVDSSTVLRRAVMKGVTSVEVGWSQPVEGTLHALAILGLRRLQRMATQLAAAHPADGVAVTAGSSSRIAG